YGRLFGFLWGWVEFWIIRGASLAALATVFTESLYDVLCAVPGLERAVASFGFWPQRGLTVLVILGLALVNVRGVRWGGGLQVFITAVKVASLVAIVVLPFVVLGLAHFGANTPTPDPEHLRPYWPDTLNLDLMGGFGVALVGVLWAYHGWMNIAPVAEEVKSPSRNIPLALFVGVGVIIALYLGANLAYYLMLPHDEIVKMKGGYIDQTVAIGFSRRLFGSVGVALAAGAVMCSVFGALNGNLLVGPRLLYAVGEDRLAPQALGAVHSGFHPPALAILVMAVWACVLVVGAAALSYWRLPVIPVPSTDWTIDPNLPPGKPLFDILTGFAMFGAVTFETLSVSTIF